MLPWDKAKWNRAKNPKSTLCGQGLGGEWEPSQAMLPRLRGMSPDPLSHRGRAGAWSPALACLCLTLRCAKRLFDPSISARSWEVFCPVRHG